MNTEFTQQQKQYAHRMIERLAPEKLSAVVGLLEVMLDSFDRTLATAEIDDEPVTEQERRDIEASHEWFKHNHQLQGPCVRKLVLTDQAKADLAGLDRATRLRIAAAIQRTTPISRDSQNELQEKALSCKPRFPPCSNLLGLRAAASAEEGWRVSALFNR